MTVVEGYYDASKNKNGNEEAPSSLPPTKDGTEKTIPIVVDDGGDDDGDDDTSIIGDVVVEKEEEEEIMQTSSSSAGPAGPFPSSKTISNAATRSAVEQSPKWKQREMVSVVSVDLPPEEMNDDYPLPPKWDDDKEESGSKDVVGWQKSTAAAVTTRRSKEEKSLRKQKTDPSSKTKNEKLQLAAPSGDVVPFMMTMTESTSSDVQVQKTAGSTSTRSRGKKKTASTDPSSRTKNEKLQLAASSSGTATATAANRNIRTPRSRRNGDTEAKAAAATESGAAAAAAARLKGGSNNIRHGGEVAAATVSQQSIVPVRVSTATQEDSRESEQQYSMVDPFSEKKGSGLRLATPDGEVQSYVGAFEVKHSVALVEESERRRYGDDVESNFLKKDGSSKALMKTADGQPIEAEAILSKSFREVEAMVEERMRERDRKLPVASIAEEKPKRLWLCCACALAIVLIVIALAVTRPGAGGRDDTSDEEQPGMEGTTATTTETPVRPKLETIPEKGFVTCGVGSLTPKNENGTALKEGAEVDMCRAIAAAVFGDPSKIEIIPVSHHERWEFLSDGSIDVATLLNTHTMVRDVFLEDYQMGFSFSDPYLYDGLLAGGVPEMVQCADDLDFSSGDCRDLKVCVSEGGSSFSVISTLMPDRNIRAFPSREKVPKFLEGECNVIAGLALDLGISKIRSKGYEGPYQVGKRHFAKEPLCMATRDDDQQWSDFVNWVLRAMIAAEAKNVTMDTANEFMTTSLFGDEYKDMFTNAIRAVGNYGEFYQRNFEKLLPRMGGLNDLNDGTTGLIYAHPFGPILSAKGIEPLLGSTLEMISSRGYVRCGVITGTPWMGLDGDYCTALAASIFGSDEAGDRRHVVLQNFTNRQDGMNSLASKEIDALAGGVLNLQNDVRYSFSQPYFYNTGAEGDAHNSDEAVAFATRDDDQQWSDYVYWLVAFTFWAEENSYGQTDYESVEKVKLFGPDYESMFQNALEAVGNYGEIYDRHVESMIPREGRNLLSVNPHGTQHNPLM